METIGIRMATNGISSSGTTCTPTTTTTNNITSGGEMDSRIVDKSCCSSEDSSATATANGSSSIDSSHAGQCSDNHGGSNLKPEERIRGVGDAVTENGQELTDKTSSDFAGSCFTETSKDDDADQHNSSQNGTVITSNAKQGLSSEVDDNDELSEHSNKDNNDSGRVSHKDEDYGYLSESKNNINNTDIEDGEKTPVQPNFCVEGMSGGGDSSVTVAALASLSRNTLVDVVDFDTSLASSCCHGGEGEDSVAGSGSAPLSVQSSEDMKLSLVSWYSEPEEATRDCCSGNNNNDILISRAAAAAAISTKSSEGTIIGRSALDVDEDHLGEESKDSLVSHDKSDEKENKTPMRPGKSLLNSKPLNQAPTSQQQRLKMHVQLSEQNLPCVENGKALNSSGGAALTVACNMNSTGDGIGRGLKKPECPRCARRSKSGTTTPAAPSRTPSRRVVQSSKSTHDLKKPIKSILKSDSRSGGSRSGSGSEKQSSMDSLGSASGIACVMTRSDGCTNTRTKFSLNNSSFSSHSSLSPEDKNTAAKLKRIEKYATLRLKKPRVRPSDSEGSGDGKEVFFKSQTGPKQATNGTPGGPGVNPEIMSKSMSFLEKSSHNKDSGGSTLLRRQGSLRLRKPSPMWEPSGTRTSALRMQKVQEAKAKTSKGASGSHSGSNHSGSGESIHVLAASHTVTNGHHSHGSSRNYNFSTNPQRPNTLKEKHNIVSAKVFTKLSSASGQTASSAMKRIRQDRGVQTDPAVPLLHSPIAIDGSSPTRMSPLPSLEHNVSSEESEIKRLESLVQRYRGRAQKMQLELERSEERNLELQKQLQETQSETNEMIEFLQAEKSLLAESLTEAESEGKKWHDQVESVKNEVQSRCSSLVRLSEQHKQEALKAQALLHRLEVQSNSTISKQTGEISEAALNIQQTRNRMLTLIEKLMKTYKVSQELLLSVVTVTINGTDDRNSDETELNTSLLVPLITALRLAFPVGADAGDVGFKTDPTTTENGAQNSSLSSCITTLVVSNGNSHNNTVPRKTSVEPSTAPATLRSVDESRGSSTSLSSSLQNLNQAIMEREAAERLGNEAECNEVMDLDRIHDGDHLCLKTEIRKLNEALVKLVNVIRVIVIHCDRKVSGVTSNILQCLQSIEDDESGFVPEMMHVQKSLQSWNDNT